MDKSTKIKILLGAAAAVAVAGGGAAIAASQSWSPQEESQAVIDDAAEQLGIEPSELSDALKQALKNRIDQAVEDGRLTEEQARELKERIDSGGAPFVFGGFGRPWHGHGGSFADLAAAASYLGLSEAELRAQLADGKTLAEVAKAQGKSVDGLVQSLVKAANERIDDAVADGRLTEAQADALKQDVKTRITALVNGEPRVPGPGLHDWFVPGFGFRFHGDDHGFMGPRA